MFTDLSLTFFNPPRSYNIFVTFSHFLEVLCPIRFWSFWSLISIAFLKFQKFDFDFVYEVPSFVLFRFHCWSFWGLISIPFLKFQKFYFSFVLKFQKFDLDFVFEVPEVWFWFRLWSSKFRLNVWFRFCFWSSSFRLISEDFQVGFRFGFRLWSSGFRLKFFYGSNCSSILHFCWSLSDELMGKWSSILFKQTIYLDREIYPCRT